MWQTLKEETQKLVVKNWMCGKKRDETIGHCKMTKQYFD